MTSRPIGLVSCVGTGWALSLYLLQHLFSKLQLVQLLLLGCSDLRVSLGKVLLLEVVEWGGEQRQLWPEQL